MGRTDGPDKRRISVNEWEEALGKTVVRKEDMNKLVIDYLVTEGYLEAAKTFEEEAGVSSSVTIKSIEERNKLRQSIQDGQIGAAISLINEHDPDLMDKEADLTFYLRQQQTIELIMQDKIEEALEYAEYHFAPLGKDRPELKDEIEKTIALLALKDLPENPVSHLASGQQRYKVACKVNQAVLRHQNQVLEPRLRNLLRMVIWAEKELDKHCDYPHLKDIAA